jgi:hypothetical protein
MAFPGILTRAEFGTGLNVKSICVNGDYLIVQECSINQDQEHDVNNYIQGGPAFAVYNLGSKKHTGSITFPLRVDQNGDLEPAAKKLLRHAAKPMTALRIDTHNVLSNFETTVLNPGTDDNKNLSLDACVISKLAINVSDGGDVSVSIDFTGMLDTESVSTFNFPTDYLLGRRLTFSDCNAFRNESSMRTTSSMSVTVENQLVTPVFLMPYYTGKNVGAGVTEQKDQIELIAVQSTKWSGEFTEIIRNGMELNTFIHGGLMHDENLTLDFGSVRTTFYNPVFKVAQSPLTPQVIRRTTQWVGINKPDDSMLDDRLFIFT